MTDRIRLFIPAAGFGERLRPITSLIPKPLLPVLGRPVIERIIERAGALCFEEVGVNAHHMRGEIERWARTSPFSASVRVFGKGHGNSAANFLTPVFLVFTSLFDPLFLRSLPVSAIA
ncbi:MAG: sugar phosphate nucleotidyltransferase [Thermodesulfovibrionales bacterium]